MQEVYRDGSEGPVIERKSLLDLLPYVEKALKKKKVNYVKIFKIPSKKRR